MSQCLGWVDETLVSRVTNILEEARLPVAPPEVMTVDKFRASMAVSHGRLRNHLLFMESFRVQDLGF